MDVLELSRWQFGITTVYHFLFVPITIGLGFLVAGFETAWVQDRPRALAAADEVLRQAVPDQFRDRRRHRNSAGIPVWHELVRLFAAGGQHLRRAAGDRGAARVLPRVHLPRAVDLRLGPAVAAAARRLHVDRRDRARCCPRTSSSPPTPGCSTRWAPSTTRRPARTSSTSFAEGAVQPGAARRRSRTSSRAASSPRGRWWPAWRCGSCCGPASRNSHALAFGYALQGRGVHRDRRRRRRDHHRRHPGQAVHHPVPADEDGRRRGAVPHGHARAVLAAHHRLAERVAARSSRSPCPACCPSSRTGNWSATVQGIDNLQPQYQAQFGPGSYIPIVPVIYWSFRLMVGVGLLAAADRRRRAVGDQARPDAEHGTRGWWRKRCILGGDRACRSCR